ASSGDGQGAIALYFAKAAPQYAQVDDALAHLIDINDQQAKDGSDEIAATFARGLYLTLGLLAGAILAGAAIGFFLSRSMANAVRQVAETAQKIAREDLPSFATVARALAAGDLTQEVVVSATRVDVRSSDEIGRM